MGKLLAALLQLLRGGARRPHNQRPSPSQSPPPQPKPVPKPQDRFPKEKPSSTKKCPQESCTPATKEEILKDAKPGKVSSSRQYEKQGGVDQANKDFDAMTQGAKVQDRGGGLRTAELPDGTKIIVRPNSSGGKPTLEIQPLTGKPTKVRYE